MLLISLRSKLNFSPIVPSDLLTTFLKRSVPIVSAASEKAGVADLRYEHKNFRTIFRYLERFLHPLNQQRQKARSEGIIYPILLEVRELLHESVSLFSGKDFRSIRRWD